ncbi:hypothetical protein QBC44DRAFT_367316 [Cladorrhinum sp. PSN332]|nr:hypothetical protein QBC44DRAFT_367316 [Cladorrhinum sp. PSN332]
MPFTRKNAPPDIPDCETLESLLGKSNTSGKTSKAIKALDQLGDSQRQRKSIVKLGRRVESIQGDPFGIWPSRSGNVAHPKDARMLTVMRPLFHELRNASIRENGQVKPIRSLLAKIPNIPLEEISGTVMKGKPHAAMLDTPEELTVSTSRTKQLTADQQKLPKSTQRHLATNRQRHLPIGLGLVRCCAGRSWSTWLGIMRG